MKTSTPASAGVAGLVLIIAALLLPRPAPEPTDTPPAEIAAPAAASNAAPPAAQAEPTPPPQPAADFVREANQRPGPPASPEIIAALADLSMAESPRRLTREERIQAIRGTAQNLRLFARKLEELNTKIATSPPSWHQGLGYEIQLTKGRMNMEIEKAKSAMGTNTYAAGVRAGVLP